jgi:hypothetical protein
LARRRFEVGGRSEGDAFTARDSPDGLLRVGGRNEGEPPLADMANFRTCRVQPFNALYSFPSLRRMALVGKGVEESGRVARRGGRGRGVMMLSLIALQFRFRRKKIKTRPLQKKKEMRRTDPKSTQFVFCFNFTVCGVSLEPGLYFKEGQGLEVALD